MIAVILAAGKGERLGGLTKMLPKPLIPVAGKPVIVYQIELLASAEITDIYILTDYLESQFPEKLGNGDLWGVHLHYIHVDTSLGTAGVIKSLQKLFTEDFLVFYGDILVNFDVKRLIQFHVSKSALATLVVHPNAHPADSDLLDTDQNYKIIHWFPKPHGNNRIHNLVNAAIYVLSPKILELIPSHSYTDFGKDLLPTLVAKKAQIYAYPTAEYIHDMGTPERLSRSEQDVLSGRFEKFHRKYLRKAVFIDRDGVLIKQVDQLHQLRELSIYPETYEALHLLNNSEYLAITITNQPMIARGLLSLSGLKQIHNEIESRLGNRGVWLDGIYYCPHHPEQGHPGVVKKYNIVCHCRKPDTGLIEQAVRDFNIDLSSSYFIGDSTTDILTAKNAGLRSILVKTGFAGKDKKFIVKPDFVENDILSAVRKLVL